MGVLPSPRALTTEMRTAEWVTGHDCVELGFAVFSTRVGPEPGDCLSSFGQPPHEGRVFARYAEQCSSKLERYTFAPYGNHKRSFASHPLEYSAVSEGIPVQVHETGRRRLYRFSGFGMFAAGLLVLITIPLIPILLPSLAPSSTQSGLEALQNQGLLYAATWVLYLISDLLFLLVFFGLYFALKHVSRVLMMIAVIFNTVFVAADVAIDIPLRLLLIGLSNSYIIAQDATQKATYLAAAQSNIASSNLVALIATFFQFFAVILASYAMIKASSFGKRAAYVGIVCGVLALLFIPTFALGSQLSGLFNIAGFVFLVIWSLLSGNSLLKLGRNQSSTARPSIS